MILLAFTSVTLVMNAILIWYVYKAFAGLTSRVAETAADFENSTAAKAWISSMQAAAKHAVTVTEATKERMRQFEPVMDRAHENYSLRLGKIDARLQLAANDISAGARRMRDVVARPAFSVMSIAAGLGRALQNWDPEDG